GYFRGGASGRARKGAWNPRRRRAHPQGAGAGLHCALPRGEGKPALRAPGPPPRAPARICHGRRPDSVSRGMRPGNVLILPISVVFAPAKIKGPNALLGIVHTLFMTEGNPALTKAAHGRTLRAQTFSGKKNESGRLCYGEPSQ